MLSSPCRIKECLLILTFSVICSPVWAKGQTEKVGDALKYLLPAVAYGMTHYNDDDEGRLQFLKSFSTTVAATGILKNITNETRPNGNCCKSFPSGHTSAAFQGAAFIHARYGIDYAWPAYAGASFVAYSRVDAKKHYVRDVAAGAAIAIAASFYFSPNTFDPNKSVILPYVNGAQFGLIFSKQLD